MQSTGTPEPVPFDINTSKRPLFRYGEGLLDHLTFASFARFVKTQFQGCGRPAIPADRAGECPVFSMALKQDSGLAPWLYWLFFMFKSNRQCNLRPSLVPMYEALVHESEKQPRKRRSGEGVLRKRILRVARPLYQLLVKNRELTLSLLEDWKRDGDVTWQEGSFPKVACSLNLIRSRQQITLLNRRWKGHALPKQINDIDAYVFSEVLARVQEAIPSTSDAAVHKEISFATGRSKSSIRLKIKRVRDSLPR